MTIQSLENVGIVVDDLEGATAFFVKLGLIVLGEGPVAGDWVNRVVGLEGVRVDIAMLETSDGHGVPFGSTAGPILSFPSTRNVGRPTRRCAERALLRAVRQPPPK